LRAAASLGSRVFLAGSTAVGNARPAVIWEIFTDGGARQLSASNSLRGDDLTYRSSFVDDAGHLLLGGHLLSSSASSLMQWDGQQFIPVTPSPELDVAAIYVNGNTWYVAGGCDAGAGNPLEGCIYRSYR
jgi:hypothetical protein